MAVRGTNSLYFSTGIKNDNLKSGIDEATGLVQGFAGTIAKINPFAILATGALTAFSAIAASSFRMMREFEQNMKEVETISEATQKNFQGIASQVFAISKISPDAPAKLAKAYYQIVSAGYDGAAGLKLLETASKAATAGVTTTETAADGITTVLNAFKLSAEEADEVADGLFQTVRLGKTNFEQLSTTLAQVAPLAAASGFSFQEVLAAVATLTKMGTPTAQAMTQIRSGIEAVTEVMGDGVGEAMTLQNAFAAVYEKAGGSQITLKELTGRVEAMNAIMGLTGENLQGAANDLKALGNSAGSAEEAFRRMAGSNVNEWSILRNRIKATTEEIGNSLVEVSSGVAKFLNDSLKDSEELKKSYDSQREELYLLKGALKTVNEDSQEFKDIRKQIIDQYPEFIKGIDGEKASTQQLLGVLDQVNEAYKLRYKYEKRQEELKTALQKEADIDMNLDKAEESFRKTLAALERIAEDKGVKLKINYEDSDSEILNAVKAQIKDVEGAMDTTFKSGDKFNTTVKGWGETYLNSLSAILTRQTVINKDLKEQSQLVAQITEQNERLTKKDLESKAGQVEAIKRINKAMEASQLTPFAGSGIDTLEKAVEARRKIIEQFRVIDQTENITSLKPFLNSEIEELKSYAEKKSRYLNTVNPGGGKGGEAGDGFKEYLKTRENDYKEYFATVEQLGKDTANKIFVDLLKEGDSYGEFLKNQLEKTEDFAKKRAIALAAEGNGINLNRGVSSVNELSAGGIMPLGEIDKDFTLSINYISGKIRELNEELSASTSQAGKKRIEEDIQYWEERLSIARGNTDQEANIYDDLRRGLEDLNNHQLRDYIKYWRDRLKEVKGNAREEKKALDNIQSAENRIAENTADTIKGLSGSIGQVSEMFRSFGDDVLADALDKVSDLAMNMGTILTGIASGNWLQVVGGVVGGITSLFSGAGRNEMTAYEKSINNLSESIKRLGVEIQVAVGGEGFEKRLERMLDYGKQRAEMLEQLKEYQDFYDSLANVNLGYFYYGASAQKAIDDQKAEIAELDAQFKEIKQEFEEYVTGSSADSLTEAILQGFKEGKKGIEDFAQTFEEAMQQTLLNIFKNNYLATQVQGFYDKIMAAAGGTEIGSLTDEEIKNLQEEFNKLIGEAGDRFGILQEILAGAGLNEFGFEAPDRRQGLAGAITNITEDTANVLEGYLNAIRLDMRQSLGLNQQAMQHLSEIAVNTRYNRYLETIDRTMTSMDSRMANVESGIQEYQSKG